MSTILVTGASGSATWRKACQMVAPSTSAASSNSPGSPSKKEIITQTTMGTVMTRWVTTMGKSVPVSSSHWNSRNIGMR